MQRSRRFNVRWVAVALGIAAVLAGGAWAGAAAAPVRVTMAQGFVGPAATGVQVAKAFGIFEKYGVQAEIITMNSTQAMQALLARQVDIMFGAPAQGLSVMAAGTQVRNIATLGPVMPYVVVTQPSITSVKELVGKKVGVLAPGLSADRSALLIGLRRLGLEPRRDLVFVTAGPQPQRIQAMSAGSIDATGLEIVYRTAVERLGLNVLADLSELGIPWDQDVVIVTPRYLEANRQTVLNVLRAIIEANAIILDPSNRERVLPVVTRTVGVAEGRETEVAYDLIRRLYIVEKPYPSKSAMLTMVQELGVEFPELQKVNVDQYVDASLVAELDRSGFIDRVFRRGS